MTDSEKLLRSVGAVEIKERRHKKFVLKGEVFRIHRGKKNKPRELTALRSKLRRMGVI